MLFKYRRSEKLQLNVFLGHSSLILLNRIHFLLRYYQDLENKLILNIPGEGRQCIDTMGKKAGESVGVSTCHGLGGNQVQNIFVYIKIFFKKYFYNKITLLPGVRGDAAAADHE